MKASSSTAIAAWRHATSTFLDIALIGIYVLFALYHFVLFARRPKQKAYLFYGLAALLFGSYLFVRSGTAASYVPDTAILDIIAYSGLFLVTPILLAFSETMLGMKVSAFTLCGLGASVLLAALLPFLPARTGPPHLGPDARRGIHLPLRGPLPTAAHTHSQGPGSGRAPGISGLCPLRCRTPRHRLPRHDRLLGPGFLPRQRG